MSSTAPSTLPAFAPSANVARLQESATLAVAARARELRAAGHPVLDLGAGEPDFDTPAFIRAAAAAALEQGATRYTATEGIPPLRRAIADEANRRALVATVAPDEVVVSTGSKQALFNACFALFGPGDEVLVPVPGWVSYFEMIMLARADAVPVMGDPASGLKVTADDLARSSTPRTRGVILNSPTNPTGAVYSADELRAILALADARGWWVIADEIYRRIAYPSPAPSVLDVVESRERLVLVDGVAKAFAMTGWRLGWSVAPRAVSATMAALQSHVTSNAAAVSQHAALAALTRAEEADAAVSAMVRAFGERRDAAVRLLDQGGVRYVRPDGAFYLYLNVAAAAPGAPDPGAAIARRLLDEHLVAVVPGSAFGTPDWIRVSYSAGLEQVRAGIERIVATLG